MGGELRKEKRGKEKDEGECGEEKGKKEHLEIMMKKQVSVMRGLCLF
jgi:hypothetical protein